jgi:chromate reductase
VLAVRLRVYAKAQSMLGACLHGWRCRPWLPTLPAVLSNRVECPRRSDLYKEATLDSQSFRILGIAGSLRKGSFNRGLLRAAAGLVPEGAVFEIVELHDIPLLNADVMDEGDPPAVLNLKERIRVADALLIATPEYNYSFPGVLKNAIDWVSRPYKNSVLKSKPVGIIGAASGEGATMRAQLALRQVFVITNSLVMVQPELRVGFAGQKFDEQGELMDDDIRRRLRAFLEALVEWSRLVSADS